MTPKKKETIPLFFRLKISLEGINTQDETVISFPVFSSSRIIIGEEKITKTYNNLGKQLEIFMEEDFNQELFFKKFNPHNFII